MLTEGDVVPKKQKPKHKRRRAAKSKALRPLVTGKLGKKK